MEKNHVYLLLNGECCCGKTVAWSCAVGKMAEGVGNFHLDHKEGSVEERKLIKMYSDLSRGNLPGGGPVDIEFYTFQLKRRDKDICKIIGMDYPGGRMDYADTSREEAMMYDNMLKWATVLVYAIPGEIIDQCISIEDENVAEGMEKEVKRAKVAYVANTIKICLLRAQKLREDCPPVLFYITKSDLAKCSDEEQMDALKRFIKDYCFFDFAEGKKQKVLGCHSTLGRKLKLTDNNKIISGFSPEGFEVPMLLAVGYLQSEIEKEWVEEHCRDINARLANLNLRSLMRVLFSAGLDLFGMPANRKRYEEIRSQISELEKQRDEIIKNNPLRISLNEILDYMKSLGKSAVFYLDEKGEEQPLEDFFAYSMNTGS